MSGEEKKIIENLEEEDKLIEEADNTVLDEVTNDMEEEADDP